MFQLFYYTIDCFMVTIYYFLGGLGMSYFMEKFFVDVDYHMRSTKYMSTFILLLDIILSVFVINMFALILRICIHCVPFPFSNQVKTRKTFLYVGG